MVSQDSILRLLCDKPKMTVKELEISLDDFHPNMYTRLRQLEKFGYISHDRGKRPGVICLVDRVAALRRLRLL